MPLYEVRMKITVERTYGVRARSSDEAVGKAEKMDILWEGHDENLTDWEVVGEPEKVKTK